MLGAIASGLGTVANLGYNMYKDSQNEEAKSNALKSINNWQNEAQSILDNAYNSQTKLTDANTAQTYKNLVNSYNPSDYVYQADEFDTSKYNVEDYLNTNKDAILADVAKASQSTAAGAGLGHSSGAAENIANSVADKSESLYNSAYQQMNQDKSFDYGVYSNYINQKQNELNALNSGVQTQMNMLGQNLQYDQTQQDNYINNKLNLGNSVQQAKASLV